MLLCTMTMSAARISGSSWWARITGNTVFQAIRLTPGMLESRRATAGGKTGGISSLHPALASHGTNCVPFTHRLGDSCMLLSANMTALMLGGEARPLLLLSPGVIGGRIAVPRE